MSLGKRIKELREKEGLTQLKASELLKISNKALSRYENDDTNPDPETIKNMAKLYNSSSDYILGVVDKEKSKEDINLDEIEYGLFNEIKDMSPELKEKIISYAKFLKQQEK